ncbi:RsmD family RNA methyltransferase [Candidatus Saccharibacteria bacterium]|nr:RsmD family RNA methyltransferase [Candidatus Saccharibacteria bacterium]MCB9834859.1 RsmD family RNA methyltransferase [Candidatus Nomurabacteria bacterium]
MLKIHTGIYKGTQLKVADQVTRPLTDFARQGLFNTLGSINQFDNCLDLYAGSGALGITALSLGLNQAGFVDNSKRAVKAIQNNLDRLTPKPNAKVYLNDTEQFIFANPDKRYDLIFCAPPFQAFDPKIGLLAKNLLKSNGLLIIEQPNDLPPIDQFEASIIKSYGPSRLYFIN